MNNVVINFKNIVSELESKELKIGFINNNIHSICLEDSQGNIYMIEKYWAGSYLDGLINKGIAVKFNRLENPLFDWMKEIWSTSKFKEYIEQQRFWN